MMRLPINLNAFNFGTGRSQNASFPFELWECHARGTGTQLIDFFPARRGHYNMQAFLHTACAGTKWICKGFVGFLQESALPVLCILKTNGYSLKVSSDMQLSTQTNWIP